MKPTTILFLTFLAAGIAGGQLIAQPAPSTPQAGKLALFQAIRSGSADELKKQLASGATANDTLNGSSALMEATTGGTLEQMKLLIDQGADINYQTTDSITALWLAVPDYNRTKLLLEHGANPNHTIDGYGVLAKLAALPGTLNIFQLLMDHGADFRRMTPDNFLLYNAASSGDTALVGFLIRQGLNVNDSVSFGDYPINEAEAFRTFATLKYLVDHGANVNVHQWINGGLAAFKGFTPLMFAALNNDAKSILYLLDHGADPNARNNSGYTPLMLFEQSESVDPDITLAFIKHGAIVSTEALDGTDALYYAKKKGNTPTVALLEKYMNNK